MGRLFWRILLGFWLALALLVIGVGVGLNLYHKAQDRQESIALGRREDFIVSSLASAIRRAEPASVDQLLEEWPAMRGGPPFVVDEAGRDVLHRPLPQATLDRARALAEGNPDMQAVQRVTAADGKVYLIFVAQRQLHRRPPPSFRPADLPTVLAIMGVISGLIFSALLARNMSRPIGKLRDGFNALASGRLDTRLDSSVTRRRDELGELGRDFDIMASQLQQLVSARDRLLHDVSHELRSPLARLQTAIGLARQQPDRTQAALERIERESQKLDALVGEVLTIARLESGAAPSHNDYVALIELLETIAEDARFETGEQRDIRLLHDAGGELLLRGQGDLLYRAFENVVRNAVRHTSSEGGVEITVSTAVPNEVKIQVMDYGPGVAEAELSAIFEAFYRTGAGAGFGLGLAIARRAIEAHGGRISARNRGSSDDVATGLVVEIVLPLATAADS